jgi:hypothetical protein
VDGKHVDLAGKCESLQGDRHGELGKSIIK